MGATLLVPGLRHHLEGRSAETAGSCPQGEERGRQAGEVRTFDNYMIHMEVWETMETEFENLQILKTMGITQSILSYFLVFVHSSSAMSDRPSSSHSTMVVVLLPTAFILFSQH